ncbi:Ig-like domain-containing protein [Mucilaginibacter sp. UR6-11]|uniref:Ig-like domain-containing protein n=1 Tax=Mucilaginibacter sp. UR6-11 TaxID=1435644 RepID=UPI001E48A1B9|nr:Ig-like domain-containing protein [Mucilaginibacter sp. UR6-11]MCC8424563.1 Ig-like domain-containing protein [Mucilaginibacter sp. UR6-11]
MTLNKKGLFLQQIFLGFLVAIVALGCAVQQRPQGGPKDHDPPKLIKANPPNLMHNFSAKEIRLDFDEYFKLNNQFQEVTVFPAPDKTPNFKIRQKSLIIELRDTLQKNTTYVINFGKAIGDVNENNILKNFTYVFSTGNHIDSLTMAGSVTNTQTGLKEKDITVMLFTLKQDSLLFGKKKPSIYTTTDSSGNFKLSNLKEGVYKIYALKEQGGDKIYNNDNELIGFSTRPINFTHDTSAISLKLFKQSPTKFRFTDHKFLPDGGMSFSFNKPLARPSVKIIYPPGLDEQKIVDFNKTGDSVLIYSKNMDFDSVRFAFYDNNKPVDTTYLRKGRKESFTKNVAFRFGISIGGELKPGDDLHLYSNLPIDSFDPTLITLKEDSTQVRYTLTRDTGSTKNFTLKYRWRQKVNYQLIIDEAAFTSIYGDKNKRQVKKFFQNKPENYSNLTLDITVPDSSKMYVVELLNDQGNPLRSDVVTKKTKLTYRNYYIGKFSLRVIYDNNRNGKWDSGSVKEGRQPENIWVYDKIFTLRPNWDSEEAVTIPREVITP